MQTGLTDAPSGLEIYVCGLSFNAPHPHPPHYSSFSPFRILFLSLTVSPPFKI